MKKITFSLIATATALLVTQHASAHVGITNLTTPISTGGQSTFAVANTTNEILFNVPHGCTSAESVPAFTGANLDTTKIEVTVPAAIVTATTAASLRPALTGEFGAVTVGPVDANGSVKLTWVRKSVAVGEQNHTATDNHLYKVSVRLRAPNVASANDVSIKKYQFLVVQTCTSGGTDYVMDWGTANSPTLLVFPDRRTGFNRYTIDASTQADFTTTGTGTLGAKLKSYFGDAAIVWVGKSGYSANPNTAAKIQALVAKDPSYSELGTKAGASLTNADTLWVKY